MKKRGGKLKKRRDRPYSRVIQEHHITYNPEWKVKVFKGEHWILTQMSRFTKKDVSVGFLIALNHFLQTNKARAKEL